jgi:Protein of unknown function (DUF732)
MTVMAKPGPGSDETAAADMGRTAMGPTAPVPNTTPTDGVSLAWSRGDDLNLQDDLTDGGSPAGDRQSWRATWRIAAALVAAGLVLAGAIVFGRWLLTDSGSPATASKTPTAETSANDGATNAQTGPANASATAPTSIVSTPDQDNKYLQALNERGISFANPEAAVYNGKLVCQDLRQGMTTQQIADAFRTSSPQLSNNADDYVSISIHAYCP